MPTESATVKNARAPFSGALDPDHPHPPADFILQSSDGVDFHVHKDILKFTSNAFDGMFALPAKDGGPDQIRRDGKPVVTLTESELVLQNLLSLVYPARTQAEITAGNLDNFVEVYRAAEKYQFLSVQSLMKSMLSTSRELMAVEPYRVFAVARLCGSLHAAGIAALASLDSPADFEGSDFPEMKLVTWDDARTLLKFRQQFCSRASEYCQQELTREGSILGPSKVGGENLIPVWWVKQGHSNICTSGLVGFQPKTRTPDGRRILFNTNVLWLKKYISRTSASLLQLAGRVSPKLELAEWKLIASCVVCEARPKKT